VSQVHLKSTLNLTDSKSAKNREISTELVSCQSFNALMKDVRILDKHSSSLSQMVELSCGEERLKLLNLKNREFRWHAVLGEDFSRSRYLQKILWKLCEEKPGNYEKLLATEGVGAKTIRALSLVAEVIYGAKPSYKDPARYSFAHGGKDATPYPVDRLTYDRTIEAMKRYVNKTKLSFSEKKEISRSLNKKEYSFGS
jgi:hypothetical protein